MGQLYQLLTKDDPAMTGECECKCGIKHPAPAHPEVGDYICCFGCGGHYQYQDNGKWEEQEDLFGGED